MVPLVQSLSSSFSCHAWAKMNLQLQQRTIQDQCSTGKDQITNIAHIKKVVSNPYLSGATSTWSIPLCRFRRTFGSIVQFRAGCFILAKGSLLTWHLVAGYIYIYMFQVPGPPPTPPAMVMVITHQPPPPCGMGGSWEGVGPSNSNQQECNW